VALIVSLFLPWYGVEGAATTDTAWGAFAVLDVLLALLAAFGLGLAAAQLVPHLQPLAVATGSLTALIGLAACLLVLVRVLVLPDPATAAAGEATRDVGLLVGVLSCLGVTAGAWLSMRDEGFGLHPSGSIEATLRGPAPALDIEPLSAPPPSGRPRGA